MYSFIYLFFTMYVQKNLTMLLWEFLAKWADRLLYRHKVKQDDRVAIFSWTAKSVFNLHSDNRSIPSDSVWTQHLWGYAIFKQAENSLLATAVTSRTMCERYAI